MAKNSGTGQNTQSGETPQNNAKPRSGEDEEKRYKDYNEQLKMLESLEKRASDLLQKMSQADIERDRAVKLQWAEELVHILRAKDTLHGKCFAFVKEIGT